MTRWTITMLRRRALLAIFAGAIALEMAVSAAANDAPATQSALGIAAAHPLDAGIAKDPAVYFSDDFESWTADGATPPAKTWDVHNHRISRAHVVKAKVQIPGLDGPGTGVLEIACWTEGKPEAVGGLQYKLGNYNHAHEGLGDGYDDLFVRYYIRFDEQYRGMPNHGSNLGGRDVTRNSAWVGQSAIRDVASHGYFYSGLQPYGKKDSRDLEMGFYSYHMDKNNPWGDEHYPVLAHVAIHVGQWHCVERHMKLNSINSDGQANADGIEELWIDGKQTIRRTGLRFRNVPRVRITFFTLETYYHALPPEYDAKHPIKVCFDNVVVAGKYIGPMTGPGK